MNCARELQILVRSLQLAAQDKQIDGINKCKVYLNELRMMYALRHRHIVRRPSLFHIAASLPGHVPACAPSPTAQVELVDFYPEGETMNVVMECAAPAIPSLLPV